MSCLAFFAGHSPIHRLDPRIRLSGALVLAVAVALSDRFDTLFWALGMAALLAAAARLDARPLARRLLHLNFFLLFLWIVLPLSAPGRTVGVLGGLSLTDAGLHLAARISLKGHAIVLLFTALAATIDPQQLAGALRGLALPDPLVHLFALSIRYTDRIHEEYARLRRAMKARAFRPRFSRHTLRTFGYLVGLLLVRGMERSERVLAAMKCRGFDGRYRAPERRPLRAADLAFAAAALAHAAVWLWREHG